MDSEKEAQLKSLAQADVLNPYNHQGIAFLFCANSRKAQNAKEFCMGPYVLNKTFYDKDKDTSLGKFLLKFIFKN
jgi:1-phosphatidylinositol-3-phosphate 5-kinase